MEKVHEPLSSMDLLLQMPKVSGDELDILLNDFHSSVSEVVGSRAKWGRFQGILKEINPYYIPDKFSTTAEADLLANVVAAYYGPLIHGFCEMVFKNIDAKKLPPVVLAPPRDAIPIATSMKSLAKIKGRKQMIVTPPVNRNITGVVNNQSKMIASQDPLFERLIDQEILSVTQSGLTEVEFGIYSTTSLIMAKHLTNKVADFAFVPLKFYGLGPNLSYVHALLSGGAEWIAERAEAQELVSPKDIANLMVLIDSLEEFGMQNMYKSVRKLGIRGGKVVPEIEPVSEVEHEIAVATNLALERTAKQYEGVDASFVIALLAKVDELVGFAKKGFPTILKSAIPPMNAPYEHFENMRNSNALLFPKLSI